MFKFFPGDHSVAQGIFGTGMGCQPLTTPSAGSAMPFWSGFMPGTSDGSTTYNITVMNTNPIWFYCAQVGHCPKGMVGAVNPSTTDTFDMFMSQAKSAKSVVVPKQAAGPQSTTAGPSATATMAAGGGCLYGNAPVPASTSNSNSVSSIAATSGASLIQVMAFVGAGIMFSCTSEW